MKAIANTIPGYQVNEYLLVLNPHEELATRIQKIRDEFADEYKNDHSRWGRPQLALLSFTQHEMMEARIINKLHTVAMSYPAFKVEMKDYGSFPSHTIYINVTSKVPVQQLNRLLRTETQRLLKLDDEHKPHFMMEPHITIGRKLVPWQYEKAWLAFSHKHFTGRFIATEMTLLKRAQGDVKYHIAARFTFENLPVLTKQGALFE